METRYTQHIQQLDDRTFPPMELWDALSRDLRSRMRRRGLHRLPPSYLGYDAMDWDVDWDTIRTDLVLDCYEFAILDRLPALRAQLQVHSNIDGLVQRNIDNFLLEKQRRFDPVGYVVFANLRRAVQSAVASGWLKEIEPRQVEFHNESRFAFEAAPSEMVASADDLQAALKSCGTWQAHLPVLARGGDHSDAVAVGGLTELHQCGIHAFAFGDLIQALKTEVRRVLPIPLSQAAPIESFNALEGDELEPFFRTVTDQLRYENNEHYDVWVQRVRNEIRGIEKRSETIERIVMVFDHMVAIANNGGSFDRSAEIARRLQIPASTFSDYLGIIRTAVQSVEFLPEK